MNDAFGALSTIVLGILAGYGVVGWVRSQTNKGRQDLEVEVYELKAANDSLTKERDSLKGQVMFLKDKKDLEARRVKTQPFGHYPKDGTGPLPSAWADGKPGHKGVDRAELAQSRADMTEEIRRTQLLPRLPNCQP